MSKIAISYRRSDAGFVARILYDRLTARYRPIYGKNAVYMDVTDIPGGENYELEFGSALKDCEVMLAIMGPNWYGGLKPDHTRISDPTDPIRQELELATLLKIRILPVLVEGAGMVKEAKLPQKLKYLTTVNAEEVRSGRHLDALIEHLFRTIDKIIKHAPPAGAPSVQEEKSDHQRVSGNLFRWGMLLAVAAWFVRPIPAAALVVLGAVGGFTYWNPLKSSAPPDIPREITDNIKGHWPTPTISQQGGPAVQVAISPKELGSVAIIGGISFSRGRMVVSDHSGVIRFWDANTFRFEKAISVEFEPIRRSKPNVAVQRPHGVHKIAFSKKGDALYSIGLDDKVSVIDPSTGSLTQQLASEPESKSLQFRSLAAFPSDGDRTGPMRFVAAGGDDGCLRIWDIDEAEVSKKLRWRLNGAGDGELSPEECKSTTSSEQKEVGAFAYSPKARDYYVIGNYDGTLSFVQGRNNRRAIRASDKPIWDVAFSPTGDRVASAGGDGVIKIWNFSDRSRIDTLKIGVAVWSLAWQDELLLSGDANSAVRLWNTASGQQKGAPFLGHERGVVAVAFHPERKWIVSAGEDGFLKVWERDGDSRDSLITIIAYKSDNNDQYIAIHRDGTFTGASIAVSRYLDMRYMEGPRKGQSLPEEVKNRLYLSREEFAQKLAAGT